MQTKLASALTILSTALTAVAVAVFAVGPSVAIGIVTISGLAFLAWLAIGTPSDAASDRVVAPYLFSIPLLLVLQTFRYLSGWVGMLEESYKPLFAARFAINDGNWFFALICLPVCFMLLGGYYLSRRQHIGHCMAWWTALWVIAEGLLQLWIGLLGGRPLTPLTFLGGAAAIGLMFNGVVICQRFLSGKAAAQVSAQAPAPVSSYQLNLWTVLFLALVAVYAVNMYRSAGPVPVAIISGSMLGGMVGWRLTTARRPADPAWAVPLFLLLLTMFYLHVGEEAITDFAKAVSGITGVPWTERNFMIDIALVGPIFWFAAAWSLWKRQPFGNFIFWFLIVGMILGEPAHVLTFPIMAMRKFGIGYEYFSGMYTALFPMIPAIIALVTIVRLHRRSSTTVAA
ncbi:MAG: hypothetical protein FJX55_18555 [Alphaproteobacteria bacterium]|nr:hypothetical protein [Alphaproteobacteria bacterium]